MGSSLGIWHSYMLAQCALTQHHTPVAVGTCAPTQGAESGTSRPLHILSPMTRQSIHEGCSGIAGTLSSVPSAWLLLCQVGFSAPDQGSSTWGPSSCVWVCSMPALRCRSLHLRLQPPTVPILLLPWSLQTVALLLCTAPPIPASDARCLNSP